MGGRVFVLGGTGGGGGGFGGSVAAFAPFGGVSLLPWPNPGCRFASLACPGLGAHCPFGARGRCRRGLGNLRWAGRRLQPGTGAGMTGVQIKPRRGCKLTAQGKRAKRCDTLGLAGANTMRPRRGQKQRRRGWCRGFCPLRGRYADAMRTLGALRKNMFSAGNQSRGKMRRVVRRSCCSTAGRGSW